MKLKLTKREIKAVKDSIKHWEKDIQSRLRRGDKTVTGIPVDIEHSIECLVWERDRTEVHCYANYCALCSIATNQHRQKACTICPYYKKYNTQCTNLHWKDFERKPGLRTCNAMIKALKNILN